MRKFVLPVMLAAACQARPNEEGELSRPECADLVRRVQRIESDDSAMRTVANVGLRSGVEGCLRSGTQRAYKCVMQAETKSDLESCEPLFK